MSTLDRMQLLVTAVAAALCLAACSNNKSNNNASAALAGIGDRAMRESRDIWVYGLKNGVFCMIHGDHSGERVHGAVEEIRGLKLSDAVAQSIPAATAQAVAQNLGTLCNKVWGSGNMTPSFADLH